MPAYRLSIIAFAAALGVAAAGQAQTPPPPAGPAHPHGEWAERHQMHAQARVKALHDALSIRADQEAAFQAFTASMHPDHGGSPGREGRMGGRDGHEMAMGAPMTAPERVDTMLKRFDERTGRMREALTQRAQAVKTFYAAISPEQRRVFDALPMLSGRGEGRMGHMGHPGMGRGEDRGPGRPDMGAGD